MKNEKKENNLDFSSFMNEILNEPSRANEAYRKFHNYSSLNQWHAMASMEKLEPINTYKRWQEMGRQVKKGAKAIALCMPIIIDVKDDNGNKTGEKKQFFVFKNNWFKLSDTEGAEYTEINTPPDFNLNKMFLALNIKTKDFEMINGNCQGYAIPTENIIAINPLAVDKFKTTIHEVAHCLLHSNEAVQMMHGDQLPKSIKEFEAESTAYLVKISLGIFDGLEYSRDYIKGWLESQKHELKEINFKRVLGAVNKILNAGTK